MRGRIVDDGTDSDGDGLTDCWERNGMLVPFGMFDVDNDPSGLTRIVFTDPNDPDTQPGLPPKWA